MPHNPRKAQAIQEIEIAEVGTRLAGDVRPILIDVREIDEHAAGFIAGALLIPQDLLAARIDAAAPDKRVQIVVYCASGVRSALAARTLADLGYGDVRSMRGGFIAWQRAGQAWIIPPTDGATASLNADQLSRYSRHLRLPEVGVEGQQRLLDARVLCVGAGGLGSPASLYLTAAGIGTLGIIDDDVVDLSNLQRQIVHGSDRVGMAKVDSAQQTLAGLNPDVSVVKIRARLRPENALAILADYDVIVDGSDNFATRYLINDVACAASERPEQFSPDFFDLVVVDECRERIESFLLIDDWRKRLSGVVLMLAKPEDSMLRERGDLPVPNASGSIMNPDILAQMRRTTENVAEMHKDRFRLFAIDTSDPKYQKNQKRVCQTVADTILTWIEEHIAEDIWFLPRSDIEDAFQNQTALQANQAADLVSAFTSRGDFLPRDDVEDNADLVQAIPVAIVRNREGAVLQLRRREKTKANPLHEKFVIWAGGHVRKEDTFNGETMKQALVRELHEELRLDVVKDDLKLLGAVYTPGNGKSAKHVAVVYEWRANSDEVDVCLNSAEFFERRGTAVSGTFITIKDLENEIGKRINEVWSTEIVQRLLSETANTKTGELF